MELGLFRLAMILGLVALFGCGPDGEPRDLGTLSMRLRTDVNGITYRLRDGAFIVTGPEAASASTEDDPDAASIQIPLSPGDYTVELQDGWRLEKQFPSGFQTVNATLASENPRAFSITSGQETRVAYAFETDGTFVELNDGTLVITIEVSDSSNPPGASMLTLGLSHSCALAGGAVRCWGFGDSGRLGYGNVADIGDDETPASAGDIDVGGAVEQVSAGGAHTCAVLADGGLRCWGFSGAGRLGYGNLTLNIGDDETPASAGNVPVGGDVSQVASGSEHTCALLSATGGVRCWGRPDHGRLGNGMPNVFIGDDETPASQPVVDVGGFVVQVAAGAQHTCVVLATGAVRCWGRGAEGVLGYGNTDNIGDDETPASVGNVDVGGAVQQVGAGEVHTCALLENGSVRCWGRFTQLGYGDGQTIGDNETPASAGDVPLGGTAKEIAVGRLHTCALLETGSVRCWGFGGNGRLGYASTVAVGDASTVGDVDVGGEVAHIAAGGDHTCAILTTGAVRCWGFGGDGRIGYANGDTIGDDETPASAGDVEVF